MKKQAGIFDPWRQSSAPPVDETPARKTPTETPADDTIAYPQHCIQFNGIRAGIYVWLNDNGAEDSTRARNALIDVVHRIHPREDVAKILHEWGVYAGAVKQPNPVVLTDGEKKMTISVAVADERLVPRAIDSLALSLREVSQQFSDVRDMLTALRIRPYVK
jgi:hypothetical protein